MTTSVLGLPFAGTLLWFLVVVAFLSGIGIATIGPGGIFLTIALYALAPITTGQVAGTAHVTFIGTGLVGSAAYLYSGEMNTGPGRALAIILSLASILGALLGAELNAVVSRDLFGILLGGVATTVGVVILYRERRGFNPIYTLDVTTSGGKVALGLLGLLLGTASGLLGVGGPVLAVPALVVVGVPMLLAVAVAQVQSVFIAGFAAWGYLAQGNVLFGLAVVLGVPLLAGVVLGWKIAHLVDPARLKVGLGVVLLSVGPILAL